ncbi:heme ABC transporter substrate-binding protein IsdE [Anaerocolumna sp.]|uniref:heme ABC transporter substrate-binding protein IsdE n=1 Tax=Anaerocolumna sp. TaxID=2041569 RepID=UPI0028ADBF10|nr:heme ABC transporter substrate-binding protein IsdE [Anaerocolumna sp.]
MKKIILFLLFFTMLIAAVACSKKGADSDKDRVTSAKTNESERDSAKASVTDGQKDNSNELNEVSEKSSDKDLSQHRVIASSVAVVEILDALGVPMVGVPTSSYELPESVADAERIGNPMSPDMEVITSLEPTVIISVNSLSEDLKTQFEALKIPSEFVDLASYKGLKESILSLGTYFGVEEKAADIIAEFESKEAAITDRTTGKGSPSVLIIFGATNTFMAATENTYVGDLVKSVGATNILDGMEGSFIPVDMEFLADKNPEYILFMAHANPEESLEAFKKEFETNEAWQNFDAVKNDKVIALDTGYFGMSANLQAPEAMDKLVGYLYTE